MAKKKQKKQVELTDEDEREYERIAETFFESNSPREDEYSIIL